jgi:hypothetical protein
MAFPTVVDADTVTDFESTDTVTHNITLPANRAVGDRVVVAFASNNSYTVSGWPSGWNVIITQLIDTIAATVDKLTVAEKIIVGGEANFNLTTSTATQSTFHAYRITGGHASTPSEAAGFENSLLSTDFPALNPSGWDVEDTLWFIFGQVTNGTRTVSSWPANYTGGQNVTGTGSTGTGTSLASAYRSAAVASENPGTLSWSAGPGSGGATVGIRPAAVVIPNNSFVGMVGIGG